MKKIKIKFVEVEWDDASASALWHSPDDLPHVARCLTRGWLMEENKREVILAASVQLQGCDVGEIIAIPRGMVKRIRRLNLSYGR